MRSFLLFIATCLLALPLAEAVKAKVVSCPAWTLNKHKELRLFLKGDKTLGSKGEIDEYAGVEIEWIRGKKAVMTLFDDSDKQLEEIKLYELQTREEMHTLMIEKGFSKKTASQKVADIQLEKMEKRLGSGAQSASVMGTLSALYLVIFGVLAGKSIVNRRSLKQLSSRFYTPSHHKPASNSIDIGLKTLFPLFRCAISYFDSFGLCHICKETKEKGPLPRPDLKSLAMVGMQCNFPT